MSLFWTSPAWSWPLLLVTAAGALVLTARFYGQSRPQPTDGLQRTLVILRSAALVLLVLGMAGPLLTRLLDRTLPQQLVIVFEDSGSMALQGADGEPSRWQAGLDLADSLGLNAAGTPLAADRRILRGNGLASVREFQLDDAVIPAPTAHGTSLDGLLAQVAGRVSADPVGALVLLSDGNETLPGTGKIHDPGAPVFVVGLGDARGGADRMIKDLRYPDTAFAQDRLVIEATVVDRFAETGAGGQGEAVVRLLEDGVVLAQQDVRLQDGSAQVQLEFLPGREGLRMLDLEVSPLDNERFPGNNRVSLGIDVRKARSRILVLAPRPGWDVRFLRIAAAREARLALEVVHRTARGLAFTDSLTPFAWPSSVEQWRRYDAVILVGWEDDLQRMDHSLLAGAVEAGLGLMVLPTPPAAVAPRVLPPDPGLQALLPVDLETGRWLHGDQFAFPDSLAAEHPVFSRVLRPGAARLAPDLPPLPGVLETRLRDGARALLLAGTRSADPSRGVPLLSAWPRGQGRVVFWGGSRLWELAFWQPPGQSPEGQDTVTVVDRMLRNLLVWLADGTRESGLRLAGRRSFYQEGESMELGARWRDMRGLPVTDRVPTLEVERLSGAAEAGDEAGTRRSFSSPGFDPRRQEFPFTLPALPPGRYSLRLLGAGDPPEVGQTKEIVITAHSVEETQVRQDARRLSQLAERLGGTYLDGNDPRTASRLQRHLAGLDWSPTTEATRRQWRPTAGWPFFVVVVLLLGCEWFLRRRHGLL